MSRNNAGLEPNLTTINYFGRLLVKYGIAFLIVLMVGRMLLTAFVNYWKATHPAPPPPPTVGFGVLPSPRFPTQTDEEKPSSYNLEMAYGLQEITDRAEVFLVTKSAANLLADEKVRKVAETYNFNGEPETISEQSYRFTKNSPLDMSLEISAVDFTFTLQSNYLSRPDLLTKQQSLPEDFEAVERVKTFLKEATDVADDIATSSGKVTYLKSIGGELRTADSLSDADFLQVDINRQPIDGKYKIYTPQGEKGVISAIVAGALTGDDAIVSLEDYYRPIDYLNVETYPLRTAKSAWKSVQSGEAYIAAGSGLKTVTVREVELAYYDDFEAQKYLQPIYVFKGDNGFLAYVPAVSSEYLSRN